MRLSTAPSGKPLPLRLFALLVVVLFWLPAAMADAASRPVSPVETLSHGRFKTVQVYRPGGAVKHVVLFLSGDGGWSRGLAVMASTMVADGALVIGIDVPDLFEVLEADGGSCVFPDGDLENLSHWVQAYYKLPTYFTPLVVGYSAGATLAYAVIAQAPPGIFAGAVSLSFCQDLDLEKPLCKGENLRFSMRKDGEGARLTPTPKLHAPWVALHGIEDEVCPAAEAREFVAHSPPAKFVGLPEIGHNYGHSRNWLQPFREAYTSILDAQPQSLPAPPKSLEDLPVVEVPATAGNSDLFARCARRWHRLVALLLAHAHAGGARTGYRPTGALLRLSVGQEARPAHRLFAGRRCHALRGESSAAFDALARRADGAHRHQPFSVVRIPCQQLARRR
jgi:type IV secretory pathway VirJ component